LTTGGVGANPSWVAPVSGLNGLTSTLNVAAPNATNNVSALAASGGTTNQYVAFVPKGSGGFSLAIPDNTATGGNVRGTYSVDLGLFRSAANEVAEGNFSVLIGRGRAIGQNSAVVGGSGNTVVSDNGSIFGGANNTVQTGSDYSVIVGGTNGLTTGARSTVLGGTYVTDRSIPNVKVFGASNLNSSSSQGLQQTMYLQVGFETTSAVLQILNALSTGAASATNQMVLANNTAYAFQIICIAGVTAAGNSKAWRITGAIKRAATAASTVLVGTPSVDILAADAGASAWLLNVVADTTNGALQVQATGQAATTIRWNANIEAVQVGF
jgi:hypothetical protein